MSNLNGLYDANAEAQADFGAIPAGEYLAQVVESEMKPTKTGNGEYLELEYDVLDGAQKGRKVWARLNLRSSNATAQEIANHQFASVREATGVANPRDSQELHYKPHVIRVAFIPAGTVQKNGYQTTRDGNEVKAWKKAEGSAASAPLTAATQASAPAAGAAPPWATKAA